MGDVGSRSSQPYANHLGRHQPSPAFSPHEEPGALTRARLLGLLSAGLLLAALVALGALPSERAARALPPAGTDDLDLRGQIQVLSRLGSETVQLQGNGTVEHDDPYLDGGVEVVDTRITGLLLNGQSTVGGISVRLPEALGPRGPSSAAADTGGDGNGFEVNQGLAFRDGFGPAIDIDSGTSTSASCSDAGKDRHRFGTFGLELPPLAAIGGISVRLDARADSGAGGPFMCVELSSDGGATWTAPKMTGTLLFGETQITLGGAADTWGRSWTPSDIEGSNLLVRVTNVSSQLQRDFFLDYAAVSVFYQAPSPGEIRSLQPPPDQFPASSFFDLYVDVTIPANPPGLVLHNQVPLHVSPYFLGVPVDITVWPPTGVTYRIDPINGVDNDGDTAVDEDTADDDGDGLYDEDRPGSDPVSPGTLLACGDDADCDGRDGEDPPSNGCNPAVCDDDDDGETDEDPSCVPLLNPSGRSEKAGVCITDLSMLASGPAPEEPTFSVAPGGPSGLHPADLLAHSPNAISADLEPPFVNFRCQDLGFTADGCDAGTDGDQDDIDALSYGADFASGPTVAFSVAPDSGGLPGSAVAAQAACKPPQPQADEFSSALDGTNTLVMDGDGQNGSCPAAFFLGLQELPLSDDLDVLTGQPPSFVDPDGDGIPDEAITFSLASGSPTLAHLAGGPADIFWVLGGFQPSRYAAATTLGLQAADDIDALCLGEDGDLLYDPATDVVIFSLAPGSPTLSSLGASAADLLEPGPSVAVEAADMGLDADDDLDAIKCGVGFIAPPPTVTPTTTSSPAATPARTATATPPNGSVATATPTSEGLAATATPFGGPGGITAPGAGFGFRDGLLASALVAGALGLGGFALIGWTLPRLRRR